MPLKIRFKSRFCEGGSQNINWRFFRSIRLTLFPRKMSDDHFYGPIDCAWQFVFTPADQSRWQKYKSLPIIISAKDAEDVSIPWSSSSSILMYFLKPEEGETIYMKCSFSNVLTRKVRGFFAAKTPDKSHVVYSIA